MSPSTKTKMALVTLARVTLANNFLSSGVVGSGILPHPLQSIINIIIIHFNKMAIVN